MTSKKAKASVITMVASGAAFLMVWKADEYLYGSKGKAWLIDEFSKRQPVDIDEAKAWLKRTPLFNKPEDVDKDVDAVVDEGLSRGWLVRITHKRGK